MPERLLVIGGDAGGMSAAAQARRRRKPDELEIVAFERGDYVSYAACGLPYYVADVVTSVDDLIARTPEQFREQGIDVQRRHEVVAIDLDGRTVEVRDLDAGATRRERFDQLVVATGATPNRPAVPGADGAGIFGLQTLGDGEALRAHIDAHRPKRAVVVGGGYIGLEMAEAMKRRDLAVTVVEGGPQVLAALDPDMGELVAEALRGLGCDVRTGAKAEAFALDARGHVEGVVLREETVPADLVVLGLGMRPNVELARAAGLAIGPSGAIATDRRMATSTAGAWAAGDCAESFHRVLRAPVNIALGTHASKQGRAVGVNATGGYLPFPGVIGTAVTRICALEIGRTGLNEREATKAGFAFETARIEATTKATYFPGSEAMTVKVLAERESGRLLGGQIVGHEGAGKRIDVLATAIWNEMTADDFTSVDLGYAPPLSPVWDATLVAARRVAGALKNPG
jgi:NADPH-dependent 2,4-dienoyl-CoA reductase/sulfur reductase-like enzyme